MANAIVVNFLIKGMPDVSRAMKSVETATAQADRARTSNAERASKQRVKLEEREAKEKIRAMLKADREIARLRDRAIKGSEREAAKKVSAAERAAKAKIKADEKAEREAVRAAERSANERLRIERKVDAEFKRMERDQQRRHQQATREREKDNARIARESKREQDKIHRAQTRQLARDADRDDKKSQGRRENFARGVAQGMSSGATRIAGMTQKTAGIAAQLGGGFDLADVVMGEQSLRKQAAQISANTILSGAGLPGADKSMGRAVSTEEVLSRAKAVGIQQNIDPAEVLKGIDEIKKLTGNVEFAMNAVGDVAKLATATGGNLGEMSGMAANIMAADPDLSNAELQKQMRIFTRQGVVGGVEVGDFARYGSRITSAASSYGVDPSKGITKETNEATLGAMMQMSRQYGTATTPAEAAMGALRFTTDIAKNADSLKSKGIEVSDGNGGLRNMKDILVDMIKMTKGDITKFSDTSLGERGVKPLEGAAAIFKNAGGGQKGLEALEKEFAKYTTGVTEAQVDAANKRILSEQQAEMEMRKFKEQLATDLLPVFGKLAGEMKNLAPAISELLTKGVPVFAELIRTISEFVAKNDWLISTIAAHPIGAIMAAEVTKSIAGAGIGKAIEGALSAKGGLAVGAAVLTITAASIAIESIAKEHDKRTSAEVGGAAAAFSVAAGVRAGDTMDEASLNGLKAQRDVMKQQVDEQRKDVNKKDAMEYVGMAAKAARYTPLGFAAGKLMGDKKLESDLDEAGSMYQKGREDRLRQSEESLAKLNKAIEIAAKGLTKLGDVKGPDGSAIKPAAATTGIAQRTQ